MSAPTHPRVVFLVNGSHDSPMADRARAFAPRLAHEFDVSLVFREGSKPRATFRMLRALATARPALVYVLDVAYSGVLAAAAWKLATRTPVVVDTGDAIVELATAVGERGRLGMLATRALEGLALRVADHVICRGTKHVPLLRAAGVERVSVVQDGVDTAAFASGDGSAARRALGIPTDAFVVGVVGSATWSARQGRCYGSELVELLGALPDPRVRALLVGDGTGIPYLRQRAAALGVSERLVLAGRQPYERLPDFVAAMDVCVSTQTNDVPGQVRTTGKLPLYLASGRAVLATDVGEASLVLPPEALLPFEGSDVAAYEMRLAERVSRLADETGRRALVAAGLRNAAVARERFDYDVLVPRVAAVLHATLARHAGVALAAGWP